MKKLLCFLVTVLLSVAPMIAQNPCYDAAFKEGNRLYGQGSYSKAKETFVEAKNCPNVTDKERAAAESKIRDCNEKIAEAKNKAEKKRLEEEAARQKAQAAKTAYMNIRKVDFCNVNKNGQMLENYGVAFRPSSLKYVQPRVTYDALLEESQDTEVFIKVYNPKGNMVPGKYSSSDYTYYSPVSVAPGKEKTAMLLPWNNNGMEYSVGTYKFEIWCNDQKIFTSTFKVEEDEVVETPPVIVNNEPTEKKAEITVYDQYGNALEYAKVMIVESKKNQYTDSEGKCRIDMSDRDEKNLVVSHESYQDTREVKVRLGDQKTVRLYQPVVKKETKKRSVFNAFHYVIPGLAQMKVDRVGEGVAILGGELLLVGGGLVSNAIAQKELKLMQNDNVTLADFQSGRKKYGICRSVNIGCYAAAAVLYVVHLSRTINLASEYRYYSLSFYPTVTNVDNAVALGVGVNLNF